MTNEDPAQHLAAIGLAKGPLASDCSALVERCQNAALFLPAEKQWQSALFSRLAARTCAEFGSLKSSYYARPIDLPLAAWRARNLLELWLLSWWCELSEVNAWKFWEDQGRDQRDLIMKYEKRSELTPELATFPTERKKELTDRADALGIELDGSYSNMRKIAAYISKNAKDANGLEAHLTRDGRSPPSLPIRQLWQF